MIWNLKVALVLTLTLSALAGQSRVAHSSNEQTTNPAPLNLITPEVVRPLIVTLAGAGFEGRGAGYPGEKKAAEFIAEEFKKIGLEPAGDRVGRSYFQEFKFHPRHPVVPWEMLTSRNVLGFIEGSDPVLKHEIVVVGAHYDGQGRAGQADPMRFQPADAGPQSQAVWNSANDNATGVSAVLAAARAIKLGRAPAKRSVLFIAFGCEEHGMSGSIQYVTHPAFELGRHVAMINYEKLGRAPDKSLSAQATSSSPAWDELIQKISTQTGTAVKPLVPYVIPDSDHYPFAVSGIPTVMFIKPGGGEDAHLPTDTAEKIDYERVAEYARYGLAVTLELANRTERLPYAATLIGRDPGLICHLAADAEADSAGLRAPDSGLKVTGVIAGGAAYRAGLRVGDLMVNAAGSAFPRGTTLETLQKLQIEILTGQKGDRLPVTIIRGKQRMELTIELRRP